MTELAVPRIAVVIVNYRTADMTIAHFAALKRECGDFAGATVYIVDNASPGDDAAKLAAFAATEPMVRFMASPDNRGFGAGNNIALREALKTEPAFDYVLLLNPDAWPRDGALKTLADFLAATPLAGVVGPRLEHEDGVMQASGFRFFSVLSEFDWCARTGFISAMLRGRAVIPPQPDEPAPFDWLSGAALLFRREVFESVGLFDETYFLYYEETDLMRRARRAGWRAFRVPAARIVHLQGKSVEAAGGPRVSPESWYRSRRYYFRKNHGALYAFVADIAWLAGAGWYWLRLKFSGQPAAESARAIGRFVKSQFGGGLGPPPAEKQPAGGGVRVSPD